MIRPALRAVLVLAFGIATSGLAADPLPNVAVLDLKGNNASASEASGVTGFIRTAAVRVGAWNVVEKANMEKILAEQAFQQTGCTSSECAVRLGKLLNVQKMVVGEYTNLEGVRFINASLVNVETGRVEATGAVKGFSITSADEAAAQLVAQLTGRAAPAGSAMIEPTRVVEDPSIGIFFGIGSVLGGSFKGTSDTAGTPPVTLQPYFDELKTPYIGGGIRYLPAKWLMLEALLVPGASVSFKETIKIASVPPPAGGGGYRLELGGTGFDFVALWVRPLSKKFRTLAGAGLEIFDFDKNAGMDNTGGGLHMVMQRPFIFYRPVLEAGLEWKPQPRFGWSIRAALYPVSAKVRLGLEEPDLNSSGGSLALPGSLGVFTLPMAAGYTSIALYF